MDVATCVTYSTQCTCTCILPLLLSLPLTVAKEGAKLVRVDVVVEGDKELLVELESRRELNHHLPHTLQELGENGRRLT